MDGNVINVIGPTDSFLFWIERGKPALSLPFSERLEMPPKITLANIAVFDPIKPDLFNLSMKDIIPSNFADIASKGCKF
jgi:hypothetical protein